jgi:hypothetical protein
MRPMIREPLVCSMAMAGATTRRLTVRAVAMGFTLAGYSTQYVLEL